MKKSTLPLYIASWHKTKLKSSGRQINIRPFTVAESKNMMIKKDVSESEFLQEVITVITSCIKEDDIKAGDLNPVDFEFIFYDIRSISEGDIIEFEYTYLDDENKEKKSLLDLNIKDDLYVDGEFGKDKTLDIKENKMKAIFRFPNMIDIISLESKKYDNEELKVFDLVASCLTSVAKEEQVYNEFTKMDALEFINSLPVDYLKEISEFFQNMPKVACSKEFIVPGKSEKIKLSSDDIKSFLV